MTEPTGRKRMNGNTWRWAVGLIVGILTVSVGALVNQTIGVNSRLAVVEERTDEIPPQWVENKIDRMADKIDAVDGKVDEVLRLLMDHMATRENITDR